MLRSGQVARLRCATRPTLARPVLAGLLPTLIGLTGGVYFFGALVLGALFLVPCLAQAFQPSTAAARRVVLASVLYLPLLLALMALDKVG